MTFLGIIEHEFEMKMESGSSKKNRTLILVCITMNLFYKLFGNISNYKFQQKCRFMISPFDTFFEERRRHTRP